MFPLSLCRAPCLVGSKPNRPRTFVAHGDVSIRPIACPHLEHGGDPRRAEGKTFDRRIRRGSRNHTAARRRATPATPPHAFRNVAHPRRHGGYHGERHKHAPGSGFGRFCAFERRTWDQERRPGTGHLLRCGHRPRRGLMLRGNRRTFSRPKMPIQYFQFDVARLASYHPERSATETRKARLLSLSWPSARGVLPPRKIAFSTPAETPPAPAKRPHTRPRRFGIS